MFFKKYCGELYNKMGLNVPFLKLIFLAIRLRQKTRNLFPYISMIAGRRYFNFNYKYHISSCGIVWNCDENKWEQTVWSLAHTSSMCKACVLYRWRYSIQSLYFEIFCGLIIDELVDLHILTGFSTYMSDSQNLSCISITYGGLFKYRLLGIWGLRISSVMSYQVMLRLLVWRPHFENHCPT